MKELRRLRAGVIGAGSFGSLHARAYVENPLTELVAVADIDERRAREVAAQYGARPYMDFAVMLENERLDIVSVATPDDRHVGPAVHAAEARVNILLEKPIAMDLEDADRILKAVSKAGVKLMVNFILRFDPRYRMAHEYVVSGRLGEVVTMWARRSTLLDTARKYGRFSNLLHDVIIHDVDMFNLFAGSEPVRAYCVKVRKACSGIGVDDAYLGIISYGSGAAASFDTSWVLPSASPHWLDARFHVVGTAGAVYVDLQSHGLEVVTEDRVVRPDLSNWPVVGDRLYGNLREAVAHFIDCVLSDRKPLPSGEDGRRALQVVLALKRASDLETAVPLV